MRWSRMMLSAAALAVALVGLLAWLADRSLLVETERAGSWQSLAHFRAAGDTEFLGPGWYPPEALGTWMGREPALVYFKLAGAGELQLRIRASTPPLDPPRLQRLRLSLNDRFIQQAWIASGTVDTLDFGFPAGAVVDGINRLVLTCDWAARPASGVDPRELSLFVESVELLPPRLLSVP